ncbi:ferritin-like domain-containing protein [bacterium]|nr:ferritin-like domain-containing protein [bacterium]
MPTDTLKELFLNEVRDIYYAEKEILKTLPKMAKAAANERLRTAFESHRRQTEGQVERLERIFKDLGVSARGKTCPAIEGLKEEGAAIIRDKGDSAVRDAGLIVTGQKVEHYEIATYGTLHTWAELMGMTSAAELLRQTLDEEKAADRLLNDIARETNRRAYGEEAEAVDRDLLRSENEGYGVAQDVAAEENEDEEPYDEDWDEETDEDEDEETDEDEDKE